MKSTTRTRQEIIEVSARLFARYGFRKTSIDDVAAAARIGKGSVYLHFASKEELFGAVVRSASDAMLDTMVAAMEREGAPAGKVRAFAAAKLTGVGALAEEYHLDQETLTELLPEVMVHRRAHDAREHALLASVLREGNACGAFAVEHPDLLSTGIHACVTALLTSSVVKRDDAPIRAGIDEVVKVLARGLASVPGVSTPAGQTDDGVAATPDEERAS
jgi:AcrR family transcriptional regulator